MESSKQKNEIYDPIRKKRVEKTPEEIIRQALIKKMLEGLGYPPGQIAVEKELSTLPHLAYTDSKLIPKRRADVIVFARNIHLEYEIFPLLMIECKAVELTEKFAGQVMGYNAFVKAPFLTIANGSQIFTARFIEEERTFRFEKGLPSYEELVSMLKACR